MPRRRRGCNRWRGHVRVATCGAFRDDLDHIRVRSDPEPVRQQELVQTLSRCGRARVALHAHVARNQLRSEDDAQAGRLQVAQDLFEAAAHRGLRFGLTRQPAARHSRRTIAKRKEPRVIR